MSKPKRERSSDTLLANNSPAKKSAIDSNPSPSLLDLFGEDEHTPIPAAPIDNPESAVLAEVPAEEANATFISSEAETFLTEHPDVFNDLINLSSPRRFVDYLDENPISYDYYKNLYNALKAVTEKHAADKLIRYVRNKKTGERFKRIIFNKLLKKMNLSKTDEDRKFLELLNEGISSRRILKIVDLYYLAEDDERKPMMDALIWLEKRRGFMKACLSEEPKVMDWLENEEQAEMKARLVDFTQQLRTALSRTSWGIPAIMDVRMLWHTYLFNNLFELDNHVENAQILQETTIANLKEDDVLEFFLSVFPCPWTCFLDNINGLKKEERSDETLTVDEDIVMWQLITQISNGELANIINSLSQQLDVVADAYETYRKTPVAAPLAESITSILSPIHNSPTKQFKKQKPEVQPTSVPRKLENTFSNSPSFKVN